MNPQTALFAVNKLIGAMSHRRPGMNVTELLSSLFTPLYEKLNRAPEEDLDMQMYRFKQAVGATEYERLLNSPNFQYALTTWLSERRQRNTELLVAAICDASGGEVTEEEAQAIARMANDKLFV